MKTYLFFGDSVTAADRKYGTDDLGDGYVSYINGHLRTVFNHAEFRVINKGFDGHRAQNLLLRLNKDCLEYKPDILTILIGVNDCWKAIDTGIEHDQEITEAFERCLKEILRKVKEKLPNCRIVLMEPFLIPAQQNKEDWRITLYSKIEAVRRLSRAFGIEYIPLDGLFAEACALNDPNSYSIDSVHPIADGSRLIAEHWIKRVL